MSSKVDVDVAKLTAAVREMTGLAGRIGAQRARATQSTPMALPSLQDGSQLAKAERWLDENSPMVQGVLDVAVLLDTKGSGKASFQATVTPAGIEKLLGETLAQRASEMHPVEGKKVEQYQEILARNAGNSAVMSAMFNKLGPEGTLRSMSNWVQDTQYIDGAASPELKRKLLEQFKRGLQTASNAPASEFDGKAFGAGLVDQATINVNDLYGRGIYNPSGALAYLLHNGRYGQPFLGTVAEGLDEYERVECKGSSRLWGGRPILGADFRDYLPWGDAGTYDNIDPMTSLMSAMENDPEYALDFFSDNSSSEGVPSRADYYIRDRAWRQDGFSAIAGVLDAATTDPDIIGDPTSPEAKEAADLASLVVKRFSERPNIKAMNDYLKNSNSDASESLAHIMTTYMEGVNQALVNNQEDAVNEGSGQVYSDAYSASIPNVPNFDLPSLRTFSSMVMSSDEGFAELRNGLNGYRADTLGSLADRVADGEPKSKLDVGIQNDARLEGFFIQQLGDARIAEGTEKDARIQAWVDTGGDIVDLIPVPGSSKVKDLLGDGADKIYNAVVDRAKGEGKASILDALKNNESTAVNDATTLAERTLNQQQYAVAWLLDNRGLSADPDSMSDVTRPNGQLHTWDQFQELNDEDKKLVLSEIFSTDKGVNNYFDREEYEQTYRTQFEQYFKEAKGEEE